MPKYVIVAESGADIPVDLAEHYGISIVPMHVSLDEETFEDGEIPVADIFAYFDKTKVLPKTSGSTPSDFSKVFDKIHEASPEAEIIHLAYSAVTTCSYESALIAAEGRGYVHHFDTKNVSAGQGMIALSVAEHISENPDIEMEELKDVIADRITRMRMGFLPSDLRYLHAGGRLSNASFIGAQLLKAKPLIEIVDGKLVATKIYRGPMLRTAQKMIEDFLKRNELDSRYLFLLNSPGLDSSIKNTVEELVNKLGFKHTRWVQTGCVISSHGGPGAFGIAGFAKP